MMVVIFAYIVVSMMSLFTVVAYGVEVEDIENTFFRRIAILILAPAVLLVTAIIVWVDDTEETISEALWERMGQMRDAWNG